MELTTTSDLKSFLRVEYDDDDTLIATIGESAESHVKNHLGISGSFSGSLDTNGQNACKIAVYQLTSQWYDNRDPSRAGGEMDNSALKVVNPLRDQM